MMRTMGIVLLLGTSAACQPRYDGLRMRLLVGEGKIGPENIELVEGQAIAIEVEPISSNPFEDYEKFNLVRLRAIDTTVLFAAPADDVDRFVLVGQRAGMTAIDVLIDDRHVDTIDGKVLAQEVSP